MPLIFQKWISRSDLHANPDILYVFGDNLERRGRGGQAKEMRGEPNAVGVVTKRKASHDESAYLTDADFDEIAPVIRKDFARVQKHLQRGGIAVIPSDGLGTGLSQLQTRAPNTLKFLEYLSLIHI